MAEQQRLFPEPRAAVILHYSRYGGRYTEEFGSIGAAVESAAWDAESGQAAYDHLEFADGSVMDHAELQRLVDGFLAPPQSGEIAD